MVNKKDKKSQGTKVGKSSTKPTNPMVEKNEEKGGNLLYHFLFGTIIAVVVIAMFWEPSFTSNKKSPPQVPKQRELSQDDISCGNRHIDSECEKMANYGSCESSPGWMSVYCPKACNYCRYRNPKVRCTEETIGYKRVPALVPGDISKLFEGLPARYPQYNVTFLSKPPHGPYVVSFSNFVTDLEIDTLLEESGDLKRSTDQGGLDDSGVQEKIVSQGRTSDNAWCMGACEQHPVVVGLTSRIEEVTQIPRGNYESFQVLRYRKGQEYNRHHDSSEEDYEKLAGPRILTFFLYLSDVEEGGGTQFTDFPSPITMNPKRGSAIMWPSVLDSDPNRLEPLAFHRAMPVIKGTKYAANHWIHLYDFEKPNRWGCTGSFTGPDDD